MNTKNQSNRQDQKNQRQKGRPAQGPKKGNRNMNKVHEQENPETRLFR